MNLVVRLLTLVLAFAAPALARQELVPTPPEPAVSEKPSDEFLKSVDMSPLSRVAVHHLGRFKSFRSFAREWIGAISGPRPMPGMSDEFFYFDLLINPHRYDDADIIYVKPQVMRQRLAEELAKLTGPQAVAPERLAAFKKSGRISEVLLRTPDIAPLFDRWRADLISTAKFVDQLQSAVNARDVETMSRTLCLVPPPGGDEKTPWYPVDAVFAGGPLTMSDPTSPIKPDPKLVGALREEWQRLVLAWRDEDASVVNASLVKLAELLPQFNPTVYPDQMRLKWETWYFNSGNLTWIWLVYLVSIVFLLMSVAYRWKTARVLGLTVFLGAFAMHTFALGLRWYVSGRWPNSNMFEAVTTSVWMGACLALVLEVIARRTPMRNLFALTAATASMCALMAARYIPELSPNINNMMPVLHDLWLYIHTNVIIASYALIFMASVTALLYLVRRAFGGSADFARAGGAASLLDSGGKVRRVSAGEVFDGATMILMELSFVMLWSGLVMGAIWADHSWGRPWGWDPKEVFALCTFLIFLILVHVRLVVRDKGLWTAALAVVGCGVMLFNWIVINFIITGLHSYA
ncbi:MAG TPA: cytochrome c biogenesis protein CcsA [Phycisphaerales bacterium]|nr:cytochrome c biogenesis protein CcsA [Phycisphaerales bacterium]